MIRLTRVRTAQAIPASFHGPGRLVTERDLLTLQAKKLKPLQGVWKNAKAQLRSESDGKCAYCEGKADHVAYNDVEHFRPKSDYWWLAYCWENYTYSCQLCNQKYKKAHFPMKGTHLVPPALPDPVPAGGLEPFVGKLGPDPLDATATKAYRTLVKAEKASLPDPYDPGQDPEKLFTWFADPNLGEVEMRARGNGAKAKAAMAAANEFLGLNRQELKSWRWVQYEKAETLADVLSVPLPPAQKTKVENMLKKMMSVQGEFAGMVRFLVREVKGLPL